MSSNTSYGRISPASIASWLKRQTTRDYRDPRHPHLRLRADKSRTKASVFLVLHRKGKVRWEKRGTYPGACLETIIKQVPTVLALLNEQDAPAVTQFATVGQLLTWYVSHIRKNTTISATWRNGAASVVKTQLSRVALMPLDISFADIDSKLIKPMLADGLKPNYIKQAVSVLKRAYATAAGLRVITSNPLAGYTVDLSIKLPDEKSAQLVEADLPELFQTIAQQSIPQRVFFLLQLMFGCRINEVRQARWEHFAGDFWYLPAANTKTKQEHRLPLTAAAETVLQAYKQWQLKHKGKRAWLFPSELVDNAPVAKRTAQGWSENIRFKEFTSHDLRKVARTVLQDMGVDTMIGERILNHALPVLLRTYVHTHLTTGMVSALESYHQALIEKGFSNSITEILPRSCENLGLTKATADKGWL